MFSSIITATGSHIPPFIQSNESFESHSFYKEDSSPLNIPGSIVVEKFKQITGIRERRYTTEGVMASDMGSLAAIEALGNSQIDAEEIDQLIVAHNFGDVHKHTVQTDAVPSLASRIKHTIGIVNPNCVAYDILFGCCGWLQGIIQAHSFFKAGMAKKALVIGTETLSKVIDRYDRDCMIFSDGAGAAILEYRETTQEAGILGVSAQTHSYKEIDFINMGVSYHQNGKGDTRYLKMKGRKVYEFAMMHVPVAMKDCLDKSGVDIGCVKKILIHQANEKMDEGIIERFYGLYNKKPPEDIMPMSIHKFGNSSVATVPTLLDLILKGNIPGHSIKQGDIILFAAVGAGMNINAVCYRW